MKAERLAETVVEVPFKVGSKVSIPCEVGKRSRSPSGYRVYFDIPGYEARMSAFVPTSVLQIRRTEEKTVQGILLADIIQIEPHSLIVDIPGDDVDPYTNRLRVPKNFANQSRRALLAGKNN